MLCYMYRPHFPFFKRDLIDIYHCVSLKYTMCWFDWYIYMFGFRCSVNTCIMPQFIYLWMDTGCFHLLASVNNAVMNMDVQISLQDPIFSTFGYIPRSGIARTYGNSGFSFIFWRNSILLFIAAAPFCIPTNNAKGFQFFHILTKTCYLLFFFNSGNIIFYYVCLWLLSFPKLDPFQGSFHFIYLFVWIF